jgi:hypothetical protein
LVKQNLKFLLVKISKSIFFILTICTSRNYVTRELILQIFYEQVVDVFKIESVRKFLHVKDDDFLLRILQKLLDLSDDHLQAVHLERAVVDPKAGSVLGPLGTAAARIIA